MKKWIIYPLINTLNVICHKYMYYVKILYSSNTTYYIFLDFYHDVLCINPGLAGRAWSTQDGRPRPTTPDFNCSIFIFYFQKKLSFSNKFHQTRNQMLQLRLFTSYLSDVFLNSEAQSNPENHVTPTKFDML